MSTTPVLQALLVADHIYQDKESGKMVICGVFHTVYMRSCSINQKDITEKEDGTKEVTVPINSLQSAGSPYCYFSLTEVRGTKTIELRFVNLKTNKALFGTTFEITSDDPLQVIQGNIGLPTLRPEGPGVYSLELLSDNVLLGSHRINVAVHPDEIKEVKS